MIRKINNIRNNPKIIIENKMVKLQNGVGSTISSSDGLFKNINENHFWFIKLSFSNLDDDEIISEGKLIIETLNQTEFKLRLVKLNTLDFSDSTLIGIAEDYVEGEVENEIKIDVNNPSLSEDSHEHAFMDITSVIKGKSKNDSSVLFLLTNDITSMADFYDYEYLNTEGVNCVSGFTSRIKGIDEMGEYDEIDFGGFKGIINLNSLELFGQLNGLQSINGNSPITVDFLYSKSSNNSNLNNKLLYTTDYSIKKENGIYLLDSPTGFRRYYYELNKSSLSLLKFNIRHLTEHPGKLFFSEYDLSYLYEEYNDSGDVNKIIYYDKNDCSMTFELLESKLRLTRVSDDKNNDIIFTYLNGKLNHISNQTEQVTISKNNSTGLDETIQFTLPDRFIKLDYNVGINMKVYDKKPEDINDENLIENYNLLYDNSDKLIQVENKISNNKLHIGYNGDLVSLVTIECNNQIILKKEYEKTDEFVKVTIDDDKEEYFYFDNFNRCILVVDDKKKTVSYDYGKISSVKQYFKDELVDDVFEDGYICDNKKYVGITNELKNTNSGDTYYLTTEIFEKSYLIDDLGYFLTQCCTYYGSYGECPLVKFNNEYSYGIQILVNGYTGDLATTNNVTLTLSFMDFGVDNPSVSLTLEKNNENNWDIVSPHQSYKGVLYYDINSVEYMDNLGMTYFYNVPLIYVEGDQLTTNTPLNIQVLKNVLSTSNLQHLEKPMIENHSFEQESFESSAWSISGATTSEIKTENLGIDGNKCLKIRVFNYDNIKLSQKLIGMDSTSRRLRFFAKSNSNSSTIGVKISGTYYTMETTSDSSSKEPVLHTYNYQKSYPITSEWTHITTDSLGLQHGTYSSDITLEFSLSGSLETVLLDEVSFINEEEITRNNLIENGYFNYVTSNVPDGWTLLTNNTNDGIIIDTENEGPNENKLVKFNKTNTIFNTDGTLNVRGIARKVNIKGDSGDSLLLNIFAKANYSENENFYAFVKLYKSNLLLHQYNFPFNTNFENWQLLSKSIQVQNKFDSIDVGIIYVGLGDVLIDSFELYKEFSNGYYVYNEMGNIIESSNKDTLTKREYNHFGKVKRLVSSDGRSYSCEYDMNNRMSSIEDIYGNKIQFTYDGNGYPNTMTLSTYSIDDETLEEIINSQINDSNGVVISSTDEYSNTTYYSNNYANKTLTVTDPNGQSMVNSFDKSGNLIKTEKTIDNINYHNMMGYNELNLLTSANANGLSEYTFTHNPLGEVLTVKNSNNLILENTYNSILYSIQNKGALIQKKYNTNNLYEFNYDSLGRIKTIVFNTTVIFTFYYNEKGQVTEVVDNRKNKSTLYFYDMKGRPIRVVDHDGNILKCKFDNLDSVQSKEYIINNKKRIYNFEHDYEYCEYTKDGYINRIDNMYGDEVIRGGSDGFGMNGAKCNGACNNGVEDGLKVYQFQNGSDALVYPLEHINSSRTGIYSNQKVFSYNDWEEKFKYNKTFYMWIKPTITNATNVIFTLEFIDSSKTYLCPNSSGKIQYLNAGKEAYFSTANSWKLNQWNLVGIRLFESSGVNKAIIILNGTVTLEFEVNENIQMLNKLTVCEVSANSQVVYKVGLISIGAFDYTSNIINGIYNEGLKVFSLNKPVINNSVIFYESSSYDDMTLIPLHGSLESSDGLSPKEYVRTNTGYRSDKAKLFKYDSQIDRHVYGSYSSSKNMTLGTEPYLSYNLPLSTSGTIAFRFKLEGSDSTKRTIFTTQQNGIERIGVYFNVSSEIYVIENSSFKPTGKHFSTNTWHSLVLTYDSSGYKLYIDKTLVYSSTYAINLTNGTTYFGCCPTNSGTVMNGMLEMIAYSSNIIPLSKIESLSSALPYVIKTKHDNLGRVVEDVFSANDVLLKTQYIYDKLRIQKEIKPNDDEYSYIYDNVGNITRINKNQLLKESYVYDRLQRLISETNKNNQTTNYAYDLRGNILSITGSDDDKDFIYNVDKLTQIKYSDNRTITLNYANSSQMPTSITNTDSSVIPLSWEGRRLTAIGNNISYSYNEKGIRTKKIVNSLETSFVLEGSNIISMTKQLSNTNNVQLDFIYNNKGTLLGLIESGNVYLYQRDITNKIIKIIDIDGNIMVEYDYNAWGKVTKNILVNSNVSNYNPFMYKGYYYDEETSMYYCNSRYYAPELCRWISPDSIEYLDPQSINGLNLYCYCMNNPVMYSDGSGHMPEWLEDVIIGLVIIAGTALIVTALTFTGGTAAAFFLAAGKTALLGLEIAAVAGVTSGAIRTGRSLAKNISEGNNFSETIKNAGKSFLAGFGDGFLGGAQYYTGSALLSIYGCYYLGTINDGYGAITPTYMIGYQNPNVLGFTLFASRIGSKFRIDLDPVRSFHYHYGDTRKKREIHRGSWLGGLIAGVGVGIYTGFNGEIY